MHRYRLTSVRGVLMVRAAVHHGDVVRVIKLVVDTGASKKCFRGQSWKAWDMILAV